MVRKIKLHEYAIVFSIAILLNGKMLYFFSLEEAGIEPHPMITGMFYLFFIGIVLFFANIRLKWRMNLTIVDLSVFVLYLYIVIRYTFDAGDHNYLFIEYYIVFGPLAYFTGRCVNSDLSYLLLRSSIIVGIGVMIASIISMYNYDYVFTNERFSIEVSKNPILSGITFATCTIAFFLLYLHRTSNVKNINFIFLLNNTLLIVLGIISIVFLNMSSSKQAYIGLCVALMFIFYKYPPAFKVRYIFFILAVLTGVYNLIEKIGIASLNRSFQNVLESQSTQIRIDVMTNSWDEFVGNPIFGIGPWHELWSHNIYLDVAAMLGIVGLILMIIITVIPISGILASTRRKMNGEMGVGNIFIFSVFLIYMFSALVSGQLKDSFDLLFVCGLVITILGRSYTLPLIKRRGYLTTGPASL